MKLLGTTGERFLGIYRIEPGRVGRLVSPFPSRLPRILPVCFRDGNEISARFYSRHLYGYRASTRARGFHPPSNIHPCQSTTLDPVPPCLAAPFVLPLRDNLVTSDTYPLNPQELVYERAPNRSSNQHSYLYRGNPRNLLHVSTPGPEEVASLVDCACDEPRIPLELYGLQVKQVEPSCFVRIQVIRTVVRTKGISRITVATSSIVTRSFCSILIRISP